MKLPATALLILGLGPVPAQADARSEISAFNEALATATRHMDNSATAALWDDDGISLLPETKPIVGKTAIAKFMRDVTEQMPDGHMELFDLTCFDIEVSGDWASEWCQEHQRVTFSAGKPPFDGWGNMLLVLHHAADAGWRLKREMWNQALPSTRPPGKP
ncbi:MAG: DUF4440 domain-containing protein [Gammaproteobacteria bacterium]|nr:DUF4440 domain-containing protein [Gammaproteobacteria bacterium]